MNQIKKETKVAQVNELLNKLNQSIGENKQVKAEIVKAYNAINHLEKVDQQYNELHKAIADMNYQFQQIALRKEYHFNPEQNKLINELKEQTKESMLQGGIGTINPVAW